MNFEELQKSWQAQDLGKKISIDATVLLSQVRRNQQQFRSLIFLRDLREVAVAVMLVPLFAWWGWRDDWTYYLVAFDCALLAVYFLFDRLRQRRIVPRTEGSLKECAAAALAEVNHQIWLLRNILWWYLLPSFVPSMICVARMALKLGAPLPARLLFVAIMAAFLAGVFGFLYWFNQYAVRKELLPRRNELEQLLAGIDPDAQPAVPNAKKPFGPLLIVLIVCLAAFPLHSWLEPAPPKPANAIDAIRLKYNLPALAVVVVKDAKIRDAIATGVRKWGNPTPVKTNDVFHVGGCTEPMTATLAAMFIEDGRLRWDTTIAQMFPEWKGAVDEHYSSVTVDQLLHHRSGLPAEPPPAAWTQAWKEQGTPTAQRLNFIKAVLAVPPKITPGTKTVYSRQDYVVVGAMLETISGQDFESLMTEKLFLPLHMESAGFGAPGAVTRKPGLLQGLARTFGLSPGSNTLNEPWGHVVRAGVIIPSQSDNPPVLSPVGRVHCSLEDFARFAIFHLQGNGGTLLKPETMRRLHALLPGTASEVESENEACGWIVSTRDWAGGPTLYADGSNTMWYTVAWLAPNKQFCVIAAANIDTPGAETACDEAATQMILKWLP
jgi:CubicO group peptidase (beta-lactamase class C family)